METPKAESPGALMRIRTPQGSDEIEWDSDCNLVLNPGAARVVGAFPHRMFRSGFATRAKTLADTALETVKPLGRGSVTVFGHEPSFRAVADGSARLLRRAILRTPRGSAPARASGAVSRSDHSVRPAQVLRLAHTRAWGLAHDDREDP
ncbi:MAG TPA: hypothetical protein VHW64_00555 [Nocardioides sp.]|jgi:hypothetical protein|uniref:hypothetical protein n=1 Tax=Nocardioides sp. TaxID=35761 RepID=UPI002E36C7CE|nr:hypothetical protein [Nocardioides sp.]HEX3929164.1 hypothetical protein [Nocardioides sp.]